MNQYTNPFLDTPDPTFVLTAEERAQTFVAFDPEIVEQILRWVRPDLLWTEVVHPDNRCNGS